jgi:hypothetical protein
MPLGMPDIQKAADETDQRRCYTDPRRKRWQAYDGHAEDDARCGDARQDEAFCIHWRWAGRFDFRQEDGRQPDADDADGHVDEENPVPGKIGGDEAADRWAGEGPDKARYRQQRHGRNQIAALCGAQQHQPANGRHHCAAHALKEARHDELDHRGGYRTADGADDEDGDGDTEDFLGAVFIRHPAADGDEDGQRHHVGGQCELERDRPDMKVGSNRWKRRRDDGRVHLLHEESDSEDQRNDAVHGSIAAGRILRH